MRILHTSDWHMSEKLGSVDRTGDIIRSLERVAGYLDEYDVDVLLVTGDLFSERSSPEQMRGAFAELGRLFLPFLGRGGTMIAISGNHDSEVFFDTLAETLNFAAVAPAAPSGLAARGRLYVTSRPTMLRLADREGQTVEFVLVPYPTPRQYLAKSVSYTTLEEKHHAIFTGAVAEIDRLRAARTPGTPSVLAGHIHIRGADIGTLYKMTLDEDVLFDAVRVGTDWSYVAYGHLHKPQKVGGSPFARYAGSVERMDIAEADDSKSCVFVEIGPSGPVREPELLQLPATTFHRIEICDPETELPELAARLHDRARALVHCSFVLERGGHNLRALRRQVVAFFPRCYHAAPLARDRTRAGSAGGVAERALSDVPRTVTSYVARQLEGSADRDRLLALAERLIAEGAS